LESQEYPPEPLGGGDRHLLPPTEFFLRQFRFEKEEETYQTKREIKVKNEKKMKEIKKKLEVFEKIATQNDLGRSVRVAVDNIKVSL
jgi:hypothetical protein